LGLRENFIVEFHSASISLDVIEDKKIQTFRSAADQSRPEKISRSTGYQKSEPLSPDDPTVPNRVIAGNVSVRNWISGKAQHYHD
jgi:hypothetical protein